MFIRKLFAAFGGIALLLTVGINSAMAGPYQISPYIPQFNCNLFGTCAVYVNQRLILFPDFEDGTKENPYNTIADAVNHVKTDASFNTIILSEGTYETGIPFFPETGFPYTFSDADSWTLEAINIYGGYSDDFSEVDPALYPTIIDANGDNGIFVVENLGGKISGIEFTGVSALGNSAIEVDITSSTSYKFTVEGNEFYENVGFGPAAVDMILSGDNTGVVNDNTFTNNNGAITSLMGVEGDIDVMRNHMYLNTLNTLIFCRDGAQVYNNFLLGNDMANAGVYADGSCTVQHNTIAGNDVTTSGADYAPVVMDNNGNVVANNLISANSADQPFAHVSGDSSTFEYNALNNTSDPATLTNENKSCNPYHIGGSHSNVNNYLLGESSDCKDIGKGVSVSEDYFGTARPIDGDNSGGAEYDPGAYEAPEPGVIAPTIASFTASPSTFSPDGDGDNDTTTISFNLDLDADVTMQIENSSNVVLTKLIDNEAKSAGSILESWDGKNDVPEVVVDDEYKVRVTVSNAGGSNEEFIYVQVDTSGDPPPSGNDCAGYSDVDENHASCDAIEYVQSIGAMTGHPDGTFGPEEILQRDQVAKISLETFGLFNSSSDYCDGSDPFPDVTSSEWSYQYICRGVDLDMITGYQGGSDAGYYRPARSVNRVEFLALILRNLNENMPSVNSTSYNDVEAGEWYSGYAKYSYDHSLFVGNNLKPTSFTSRVEVAEVLYKLHNQGKI